MKFVLIAGLSVLASGAVAQENRLSFDLGVGAQTTPGYFGSDETVTTLGAIFAFDELVWGNLSLGGDETSGFSLKGGARFIAERSAADYAELAGLADVEAAFELGGGISYTSLPDGVTQQVGNHVFAEIRYGVIGHESYVAELGADAIYKPNAQWEFRMGPRLFAGDDDYAATYFSDARVGYEAAGGVLSRGVAASAAYDFNDKWGIIGTAKYEQFVNDAADSPIVQAGSEDHVSVGVILTRSIGFSF